VFPNYLIHMVDIGEQSGKLDEVFFSLSEHYDREAGIASAIKNAVTYPFIMIAMMMLVILVLITKVLPIFAQVFQQLGREMTGVSKGILNMGSLLNQYSMVFVFLLLLCNREKICCKAVTESRFYKNFISEDCFLSFCKRYGSYFKQWS
ncbi:MAG: type II secretion system F family protein, partial [Lachnospiraceae bacterium]